MMTQHVITLVKTAHFCVFKSVQFEPLDNLDYLDTHVCVRLQLLQPPYIPMKILLTATLTPILFSFLTGEDVRGMFW